MLNRPEKAAADGPRYSDRYQELVNREPLNETEQAELELETCRYQRDTIRFLASKPMANHDAEIAKYRQACEKILPLE